MPGRKVVGPATPAGLKKPVTTPKPAMSALERMRMMVQSRLNNAHEKEKVKRITKEEEKEESKRDRHREWRQQVKIFWQHIDFTF